MANITLAGKIVGKAGEPPVTIRETKDKEGRTLKIASFLVNDRDYCYFKNKEDNPGQFYRVEIVGRDAEAAFNRLKLGSWVSVVGQPIWRQYNGKKFLDVKNSRFMLTEDRETKADSQAESLF